MSDRRLGMALAWVRRRASLDDHAVADAELLERFVRCGDEAAFELLAWRHQRLIYGVCLRVLNDVHDAEDAFQAAFLVFARKARSIGRAESLAAWLYKVAYRCALTARATRARRRDREQSLIAAEYIAGRDDGAPAVEQRELRAVLDEELSRLPERFRAAAVLCYLAGKTVDEAADALGCPRGTVASRLARARERLRLRLIGRGITLPAGLMALTLSAGAAAAAPDGLVRATFHVIRHASAGHQAPAAAIAERVVRAMLLRKLAIGVAVVVALAGVFFAGSAFSGWTGPLTAPVQAEAIQAPLQQPPPAEAPPAAAPDRQAARPGGSGEPELAQPAPPEPAKFLDLIGRLEPFQEIQLGARVNGEIEKVHVKEGDDVMKGQVLFEIDSRAARLQVEQALATLAQAEAMHQQAAREWERAKKLQANNAIAREELDRAGSEAAVAAARVQVAQTSVAAARLTLDAHSVKAPIAGRITRLQAAVGVSVAADAGKSLATLAVVNPIALRFEIDERTLLRCQKIAKAGPDNNIEIAFAIYAADEKGFPHKAKLQMVRPELDPTKGTVVVRALAPNHDMLLLPGMAVRIRMTFPK